MAEKLHRAALTAKGAARLLHNKSRRNCYGNLWFGISRDRQSQRCLPNLTPAKLVEKALCRGEGKLSATGALCVTTGKYTGRSPDDKFIVDSKGVHDDIAWGKVNVPTTQEVFDALYEKMVAYLQNREIFIFDGYAGADPKYTKAFRIVNELASQNLFIHQLLLRPTEEQLKSYVPDFTIIAAPGFKRDHTHSEAAIMIDYEKKLVLIAGSQYSGEIKKSVFSVMNYLMPKQGVFPMHCSANIGEAGDSAIFFGLSGTGKTTLSADPNRKLIGDDEHGWADDSVFNFEGGCYAKCIDLTEEREPEIYRAIKFGSLVENVIIDEETRQADYADGSLTENTRVGYPVDYIPNAAIPGIGGTPKTVIFLTADAYGVMPPISKLNAKQAQYYFVSGFTSKLAGTERGITSPVPTFSTCFGAPFMPLDPSVYAGMLEKKVQQSGANVYLVNTGWCGNSGKRMNLKYTRAMVTAALNGELEKAQFVTDPYFGVQVPTSCPGVPDEQMIPAKQWGDDQAGYEKKAKELAHSFVENFKKYTHMPADVVAAGPKAE